MIKKYFDWTPRDIAQWEIIRQKGLWRFLLWYSVISGGICFIIPGAAVLLSGVKTLLNDQEASNSLSYLALKLLVVAAVCLAAGFINALATWLMEEKLYQKYYRARSDSG
jgi:uncharacterized SAM-binding protein YcdF (DUF218 family)